MRTTRKLSDEAQFIWEYAIKNGINRASIDGVVNKDEAATLVDLFDASPVPGERRHASAGMLGFYADSASFRLTAGAKEVFETAMVRRDGE